MDSHQPNFAPVFMIFIVLLLSLSVCSVTPEFKCKQNDGVWIEAVEKCVDSDLYKAIKSQ